MDFLRRLRERPSSRGQALVEMAIIAPLLVLIVMFAIDFGRVFFGWVAINNMARVGANFASVNPDAWDTPGSPAIRADYATRMQQDAEAINCTLPGTLPSPTFDAPKGVGDLAHVTLTCNFSFITPLMGGIFGDPMTISAEAAFPIRVGEIAGAPVGSILPLPSVMPTPTPTPPLCTVPDFIGTDIDDAQATWSGEGFSTTVLKSPNNNSWNDIGAQSLAAGSDVLCTSTITLTRADPSATPSPSPTPSATPVPTPTPIPLCTVPSFIGDANNNQALRQKWSQAGFVSNRLNRVNGSWQFVQSQTLVAGSQQTCATASITVGP